SSPKIFHHWPRSFSSIGSISFQLPGGASAAAASCCCLNASGSVISGNSKSGAREHEVVASRTSVHRCLFMVMLHMLECGGAAGMQLAPKEISQRNIEHRG